MSDDETPSQRSAGAEYSLDRAWDAPPELDASPDEKAAYSLARYAVQNDHYIGLYQQWMKPIYFIVGKQWVKWNEQGSRYDLDTDVPKWRQQPVTNFSYAVYRTLLAKLSKQRAALEVVPPSGDSDDRDSAKLGESIIEHLWRHLKTPAKRLRALAWILATGNVAFDVDWDTEEGEMRPRTVLVEVAHPELRDETIDVDCACDESGEPHRRASTGPDDVALDGGAPYDLEKMPEMQAIGEISLDVDDPLSYRWNPEATSEDDADEFFHAKMWTTDKVATTFDIEPNDIQVGGGEAGDNLQDLEDMLSAVTSGAPDPFDSQRQATGSRRVDTESDRVLVIKYYRKPCAKDGYPEGRHWITAGGSLVWPKPKDPAYPDGEAPLPNGFWPPRVTVVDTPIPGQPQGLGVMSQVVPLNEKYNFNDGKIGEFHTLSAMGGVIWVDPADRGITITSEPGQVKVSKGYGFHGRPPIREKLVGLPAEVYREREVIAQNLNAIAGVSQLDMGQRPEGVSAGRAFLVIQEASDAAIMPTLMAMEDALAEIGRRQLVLAQRHYTEERTIKVRGERGKYEFRSFTNADLRDGLDVRVQTGSSAPWSKSAQWDIKLSVLEKMPQLVLKPDGTSIDREQLARYLDSGAAGLGAFESDEDPDLVEIDREHAMFEEYDPTDPEKSNQLPQLAVWQNALVHQKYHFDFMKRDFGRFERWSDAAKLAWFEHLRLTTEAVSAVLESVMPKAPAPLGADPNAPPEGGDPNAPPGAGAPAGQPPTSPMPSQGAQRLTRGDFASAQQ
jgi:hypothetical protein